MSELCGGRLLFVVMLVDNPASMKKQKKEGHVEYTYKANYIIRLWQVDTIFPRT